MESEAAKDDQEIEVEVEVEVDDEEEPELAVDEIGGDYWWEDEQNGLLWIEHRVPRRTMVQPGGPGCPYRGDEFEDGRWTKIIPADTMDLRDAWEIRDNWRTEGNCDAPFLSWCGTTVFAFRGHDIGDDPPGEISEGVESSLAQVTQREIHDLRMKAKETVRATAEEMKRKWIKGPRLMPRMRETVEFATLVGRRCVVRVRRIRVRRGRGQKLVILNGGPLKKRALGRT
jgi:hypothetical protein